MGLYYYLCTGVPVIALAVGFFVSRRKHKEAKKAVANICFGAVRVTRGGRNMLIVRKEDGSFEMLEEEQARKGHTVDARLVE